MVRPWPVARSSCGGRRYCSICIEGKMGKEKEENVMRKKGEKNTGFEPSNFLLAEVSKSEEG